MMVLHHPCFAIPTENLCMLTTKTCSHGVRTNRCRVCANYACEVPSCPVRGHRFAGAYNLMRHARCLHAEEKKAPVKRKELAVLGALREAGLVPEYQVYLPFRTCGIEGGACAYLDFVLYYP